jgi:DNA primase
MNIHLDYIIQEIKKNLPILDVADEFGLKLKRSGHSYFTLCPIHGEKTPSCSLVPNTEATKDYFHCFSCGAGGDQIKLFAILNNMSNSQAIRFLAKRFGLSDSKPLPEPLVREYAKNKRDRTVEKNFLKAFREIYDDLCCLRDMMSDLAQQYEFIESLEQDGLLIHYYHEQDYHQYLLEWLLAGLFEEISFNQQIEVFLDAKGVVTKWQELLQKRLMPII